MDTSSGGRRGLPRSSALLCHWGLGIKKGRSSTAPKPAAADSSSDNQRRVMWWWTLLLTAVAPSALVATPIMSYKRQGASQHDYKMVCYYGSWAVYRPEPGKFPVENIDPEICTHLIYGFAGLGYDNRIRSLDAYNDLYENYGKGAFERFTGLKKQNPKLKTLMAIGGWNEGSVKYSNMAGSPEGRRQFADSAVEFLERYGFDGLDMDWEYPANRGGKPEDKENFVALLRELKSRFEPRGLLLTAAVSAGKKTIDTAYNVAEVSKYLDLINVMCYDYHGGWETVTGHHAPLYSRPDDTEDNKVLNVNFTINYWISLGAPREKLILGMGLYGRSFTLQRAENNTIGAPAPQRGRAGPYTREPGSLGYNEICEQQGRGQPWTIVWDPYVMAPYAYRERQWVGYDDLDSIILKVEYAKHMGLGGGMVWSIETDDFQGTCHGQKYPMLTAINNAFARPLGEMPLPPPPEIQPVEPSEGPQTTISTTQAPTTTSTRSTWGPGSWTTRDWTTWGWTTRKWTTRSTTTPTPTTTTSTTTTTTTPQPTTRPLPPWVSTPPPQEKDQPKCLKGGLHRHPSDCQKFFSCVQAGGVGDFQMFEFSCPDNTVFDLTTLTCTFPSSVPECRDYYIRKYAFLRHYFYAPI